MSKSTPCKPNVAEMITAKQMYSSRMVSTRRQKLLVGLQPAETVWQLGNYNNCYALSSALIG